MKTKHNQTQSVDIKNDAKEHSTGPRGGANGKVSKNIEEFTIHLCQHPKVEKVLKRLKSKAKHDSQKHHKHSNGTSLPKAPKLLLQAMDEDERITGLAQATRNVMKYYREVSILLEEKAKGGKQDSKKDKEFIKKWAGIEKDYQTMIKTVCKVYRENALLMASGKALAEMPNELDVFANPAFLGKDELAVAKYLGLTSDELGIYFEYSYLPNRGLVARGLASEQFEEVLKAVEKVSDKLPFQLSPKHLMQEATLSIGADFFFFASLFAQVVAVVTTIISVVAAVTVLTAAVAQAAAAVVQTAASAVLSVEGELEKAGDWLTEQKDKIRDWYDENIKTISLSDDDDDNAETIIPSGSTGPTTEFMVVKLPNNPGQTGDKYKLTVEVYENGRLVENLNGRDLEIFYGIQPVLAGQSFFWTPLNWSGKSGIYTTTWGPGYWTPAGLRWVRFTFTIDNVQGRVVTVQAYPSNSLLASASLELKEIRKWQSATTSRTPEEAVQIYGYTLGNTSRAKMELHLPNCSFLYLISPDHLQKFDTIQDGQQAGLDNCYYCIGGSKR